MLSDASTYYCHVCGAKEEHVHHCEKTNADRIRAMNDKELADLLYEVQMTMSEFWNPKIEVVNTWPDWLKQEVE